MKTFRIGAFRLRALIALSLFGIVTTGIADEKTKQAGGLDVSVKFQMRRRAKPPLFIHQATITMANSTNRDFWCVIPEHEWRNASDAGRLLPQCSYTDPIAVHRYFIRPENEKSVANVSLYCDNTCDAFRIPARATIELRSYENAPPFFTTMHLVPIRTMKGP